jgi:hypothetical protein
MRFVVVSLPASSSNLARQLVRTKRRSDSNRSKCLQRLLEDGARRSIAFHRRQDGHLLVVYGRYLPDGFGENRVEANGIPRGTIAAPANRHDSLLLDETLDTLEVVGELPERISVHLDRGYDSNSTRQKLHLRGLLAQISKKVKPAPIAATKRWVVERTNSWSNAHKKLVWCTERVDQVIDFWLAFSAIVITVGRLVRKGWTHYRWEGRPCRRP